MGEPEAKPADSVVRARDLLAAATKGPWERIIRRGVADVIVWAPRAGVEPMGGGTPIICNCEYRREDGALIAAAPELLEAMADELTLRRAVARASLALTKAQGDYELAWKEQDEHVSDGSSASVHRNAELVVAVDTARARMTAHGQELDAARASLAAWEEAHPEALGVEP